MKLLILSTLLFLTACDLTPSNKDEINYRKLVDKKAEFIGQGIKVPKADKIWDWLLADLNSTAQKSSQVYEIPSGSKGAKYLRSFKLYDEIGFVWSWQHQDLEVFLIYTFMGHNGYSIRTVHNTHSITVDEAILAVFFDSEFSHYLQSFEVEKWLIKGVDDDYDIESLGFLGQQMFSQSESFVLFEGRIITLPWTFIRFQNHSYELCDSYYSSMPCFKLPNSFIQFLEKHQIIKALSDNQYLRFNLKVKIGAHQEIAEVLAGNVTREKADETEEVILQWTVPEPYLGAGAQVFYIEED